MADAPMQPSEADAIPKYARRDLKGKAQKLGVSAVVAEALERFEQSAESSDPQRRAVLAAKNFRAGNQWPTAVVEQRKGAPAIQGLAAQPARPCLTIDRVSQPVRQVSNVVRQSNFAIETLPVGSGANKATADIFNGWIRRVQNESRGDQPVEWAADGAAEGGLGWFRITAYYTDTDDQFPFDQDARLERVTNSLSVYPDPFAVKPTRSDMRFLLVTEDVPKDTFTEKWPKAKALSAYSAFQSTGDNGGWVTDDAIRTAEYWRCEYDEVRIVELNNGLSLIGDDIPDGLKKGDGPTDMKRERKRYDPKIKWSKITACEELESTEWAGTRIPFIPVLGEELNIDGQTKLRGVIEPAMDSQRMLNYTFSAAIESAALAPKAPFIYAAGQIEKYKSVWQSANTTNYFGLPYDPIEIGGTLVGPPARNVAEQPIQAFVQLMNASEEAIKATTGIFDPSLGNSNPRERSGEAIKALQTQSDFGQSNYQDNVARAMTYAGELLVELGPKLIDRPGRILQILQLDGTAEHVMVGQPHLPAQPGGMPQPVMDPQTQQPVDDPEMARIIQGEAKFYDLKAGKYAVTVTVGRDHATRRQEESAALGELIPHLPAPMQATLTPEYIETLDFTDSKRIADIARRSLPPELQAASSGEQQPIPPAIQQKMALMEQALNDAKRIIDTKKTEKDADLAKAKLEGTKDLLLAHVNNAAKILIAHITAGKEAGNPADEAALETEATALQTAHEAYQAHLDRAHEFSMAELGHQHELEQAAQDHTQTIEQMGAEHGQNLEMTRTSAALEPAPTEGAGA